MPQFSLSFFQFLYPLPSHTLLLLILLLSPFFIPHSPLVPVFLNLPVSQSSTFLFLLLYFLFSEYFLFSPPPLPPPTLPHIPWSLFLFLPLFIFFQKTAPFNILLSSFHSLTSFFFSSSNSTSSSSFKSSLSFSFLSSLLPPNFLYRPPPSLPTSSSGKINSEQTIGRTH